jgi:hypothetical protein
MKRKTKRRLVLIAIYTVTELIKIAVSGFVFLLIKDPLMTIAAKERGYEGAYGGEWLLIIAAVALTYYAATRFFNRILYAPPSHSQGGVTRDEAHRENRPNQCGTHTQR